jgi:polar amino acid transport system substrate-binding protein
MSIKWFLAVLFSSVCWGKTMLAVTTLRTVSQDAYPKYYLENGQLTGICPAFLRAIEKVEPTLKFVGSDNFFPTKRIDSDLRDGKLDAFACFAPSAERRKYMDFLEPALFVNGVQAAVLKNSPAASMKSWDEMKEKKEWVFLATMGTPHVKFLEDTPGIQVDAGSSDNDVNIEKLKASRGHVFVHFGFILKGIVKKQQLDDKVIVLPFNIRKDGQYFALSKKVSPEIKKKIESALVKLEKSGELKKIYNKYIFN